MAPSIFRFLRYARSFLVPVSAIAALCWILSIFLALYQPVQGPDHIQRIGWQSWSLASVGDIATPSEPQLSAGVDWWNVTQADTSTDSASLPLDVWNPLLPHDTGISEIAVEACVVPPHLAIGSMCKPSTTVEKDAIKGNWVRVEGNLNPQSGLMFLHVWYRRTRRFDVPLITNITLLAEGVKPTPASGGWVQVKYSLRQGVMRTKPLYLWYLADRTRAEMSPQEAQRALITELDVLYGANVPWYGFNRLEPPTTEEQENRVEQVSLTYRRGVQPVPKAPPLHFSRDGRFKIMQVADLHFSVGRGQCRDTSLSPCTHADNLTLALVGAALDAERPDLVVFTGDQLNGQKTSWDARSVLSKFARAVTERGIPWAAVFGNHDDEDGNGRAEQMRMMQALPYSLVERGPADIHGVGNYVLKVRSADTSKTQLLTLYFLDSGAYSAGYLDWLGAHPTAYDWIRDTQTNWFLQESGAVPMIQRPWRPDPSHDSGDFMARQFAGQTPSQKTHRAKPNALMFFHIPLPEAYTKADVDPATGKPLQHGLQLEDPAAPKGSDGFFEKGVLRAPETPHAEGANAREVKVLAHGHCHVTESCRRVRGVWFCFGGGGSYSGYSKVGFDRRFRIYDVSDFGETIETYKRTENGAIVDREVLVGRGAPKAYEGT